MKKREPWKETWRMLWHNPADIEIERVHEELVRMGRIACPVCRRWRSEIRDIGHYVFCPLMEALTQAAVEWSPAPRADESKP